ncbi:MAG: hypothetical protein KGH78_02255 [Candidatus Micrarchaeota archaeon]|nr:hypothetical protein [Candidatus Micrarchaeota archaeon]
MRVTNATVLRSSGVSLVLDREKPVAKKPTPKSELDRRYASYKRDWKKLV